ncbi:sugar ABC transporter ATP-binding protein [Glaciihabitans sp. dw_435]|uniref:sugar ABC transporter ATP-binding protein n=1 Tax=Glaciihabitans sp. dw_435 TaxID=2720081 RepID=UPI001BD3906E|nr:sugar ABC transporter ATP-binding protein [Glaciihabitans sp. dw_435]
MSTTHSPSERPREPGEPTLVLRRVAKSFGQVVALASADLTVHAGSIHALVGENGAGKSTLVKIVAGLYTRDSGDFELAGESVNFTSTAESKAAGIAVIYQEPTLFPDLSVTENLFMGRQPVSRFGRIDRKAMRAEALRLFERLAVRIDPDRPAEGLSIADQQILEIAKAISLDARLLIMDEPTAALSGVEVDRLFAIARSLRDEGRALVFISHRFDEVFALCDTITVMRDGRYISTDDIAAVTAEEIVRRMVGRDVSDLFPKQETTIGDVLLNVTGLSSPGVFSDITFTVRSGEIVGLAGLVGAGRSEIARAVFGVDPYTAGTVTLGGTRVPPNSPTAAMARGMALVPEDRRKQGLVLESSVARNTTLSIRRTLAKAGIITSGFENAAAAIWASRLEVKTSALDSEVGTLSGGNQQKVVLAKWLATNPRVLIIDEPTRGIDVGTKAEVHRLLSELAGRGMGILMISSELPEVLGMADRVLVMREGRLTADLPRAEATAEAVMLAATHPGGAADAHTGTPNEAVAS